MRRTFWPIIIFMLCLPVQVFADISLSLKLDRMEALRSEGIKMTIGVSGEHIDSEQIHVKGLEDFFMNYSGSSTQIQFMNSVKSVSLNYIYYIQPKKTGNFTIGPAIVDIGGRPYRSNTVELVVKTDMSPAEGDAGAAPVFLTAGLSADRVFVGQQLVYTLRLFRREKVGSVSLGLPEDQGLVFNKLGEPSEYQKVVSGKTYAVYEMRYEFIPDRQGILSIKPATMSMVVYEQTGRPSRGLFDHPFFSRSTPKPMSVESNSLELTVLPLPEQGRPYDYSSLIGEFEIEADIDPVRIIQGQSASLTVTVSGAGNIQHIPDIKLPDIPSAKIYADKSVMQTGPAHSGIKGSKTMKWAIVPEAQGVYEIPSLTLNYFDTGLEQYRIINSEPLKLSVDPGRQEQTSSTAGIGTGQGETMVSKREVVEIGKDILPIHTSIKDIRSGFFSQPAGLVAWLWLCIPVLVYIVTGLVMRYRKKSARYIHVSRAKNAHRSFARRLKDSDDMPDRLIIVMRDYFNDRFNLAIGALTPEDVREILHENALSPEAISLMEALIARLLDAVYTGSGNEKSGLDREIAAAIKQVEKELR